MSGPHDDGFDEQPDDELSRALGAPGSDDELADEERYRAMFRASGPGSLPDADHRADPDVVPLRRSRRRVTRLGAGTAVAVVAALASGGVAAASTGHLPDPLQTFAHKVIPFVADKPTPDRARDDDRADPTTPATPAPTDSPSDPPPTTTTAPSDPVTTSTTAPASPHPSTQTPTTPRTPGPRTSPTDDPTSTPATSAPGQPSHPPTSSPPASSPSSSPSPTSPPSATPTPTATATVTPTTPPAAPATTVTISAPSHRVGYETTTTFSALVTDDAGAPVAGVTVVLQRKGPHHWLPVASTTSDAYGAATFTTAPSEATTVYRLHIRHDHSTPWKLTMVPVVSASATVARRTATVTVTTQGGQAGDRVAVVTREHGRAVVVAQGVLDADGSATLTLKPKKRTRFVAVLEGTPVHSRAKAPVQVSAGG